MPSRSVIPDALVRAAIERAVRRLGDARRPGGHQASGRRAGPRRAASSKPLEECDALAREVGLSAQAVAAPKGPPPAPAACCTTLLDIPLAVRPLAGDHPQDRPLLRVSRSNVDRGRAVGPGRPDRRDGGLARGPAAADRQLREIEDLLVEEIQEEIVTEEVVSFLFQLEIFEDVPGVGTVSGPLLNWAFMRRVDVTARMVFQERWLRDNGKVECDRTGRGKARRLAMGWTGVLGRVAYSGCYGLGFGVALPVYAVASLFRPMDNALVRGLRDGAAAASEQAEKLGAGPRGAVSA